MTPTPKLRFERVETTYNAYRCGYEAGAAMFDELLEALKDMGARYGLTDVARAAIAKAEGAAS